MLRLIQLLTNELQRHLDEVTEFAVSFNGYVIRPDLASVDRDAAAVFEPLLGLELPQGLDSENQQYRRKQRHLGRRNRMLLMSLREHTRDQGWWRAYEEWQEAWNTCQDAFRELRREADEVVINRINKNPSLEKEVERLISEGRGALGLLVGGVLWGVWEAGMTDQPVEFKIGANQIMVQAAERTYEYQGYVWQEFSLGLDMTEVCKLSFETLYQSFNDKSIPEILRRIDVKIDDALDSFILRPLLVRTRCKLCPV